MTLFLAPPLAIARYTPQARCPGALVRVMFAGDGKPVVLNVRPEPGGDIPGNVFSPRRTLAFEDGERVILEGPIIKNGDPYIRVKEGWIWDRWLEVICPTATPAATRTSLPTSTPLPSITPTRIRHNFIWCVKGSVGVTPQPGYDIVECVSP